MSLKPSQWDSKKIAQEISSIGLSKYARSFHDSGLRGSDLFTIDEIQLRKMGMTAPERARFLNWVQSLPQPTQKTTTKMPSSGVRSLKETTPRLGAEKSSRGIDSSKPAKVENRFSKPMPTTKTAVRPKPTAGLAKAPVGRQKEIKDDFDTKDLQFAPPPKVNKIPKRVGGGRIGKGGNFNVPESGDDGDRVACSICGRKFASDRIQKHEDICRRTGKKRRVFNSQKQRLAGTEAASYAHMSRGPEKSAKKLINGKPKYKVEHENLVASIRAARRMQAYDEGKIKTPPKMPVLQEMPDDRVQCPYCGRRFGQEVAERHIPKCGAAGIPNSMPKYKPAGMKKTKPSYGTGTRAMPRGRW